MWQGLSLCSIAGRRIVIRMEIIKPRAMPNQRQIGNWEVPTTVPTFTDLVYPIRTLTPIYPIAGVYTEVTVSTKFAHNLAQRQEPTVSLWRTKARQFWAHDVGHLSSGHSEGTSSTLPQSWKPPQPVPKHADPHVESSTHGTIHSDFEQWEPTRPLFDLLTKSLGQGLTVMSTWSYTPCTCANRRCTHSPLENTLVHNL